MTLAEYKRKFLEEFDKVENELYALDLEPEYVDLAVENLSGYKYHGFSKLVSDFTLRVHRFEGNNVEVGIEYD